MAQRPLNEELLPGNTCFGCSLDNPEGMRIKVFRDEGHDSRVLGLFEPRDTHHGFPQIVHGGLQYTALDCMAAWLFLTFKREDRVVPLTHGAQIRYKRPVPADQPVHLSAELLSSSSPPDRQGKRRWKILGEIRSKADDLLTTVDFDFAVVSPEAFCQMTGLQQLPESFQRHFGDLPLTD